MAEWRGTYDCIIRVSCSNMAGDLMLEEKNCERCLKKRHKMTGGLDLVPYLIELQFGNALEVSRNSS